MTGIIGKVVNYAGSTHSWMLDHDLLVFAVLKQPGGDADAGCVCRSNDALADAGGLDPEHDTIEVLPWLGKPYFRWGWVPSHVRLDELVNIRSER